MKKQLKRQNKWWSLSLMVALASLSVGTQTSVQALPYVDAVLLSQQQPSTLTPNISAFELFRKAYENRYTWDSQFPGYTATVELKQGKEEYKGQIRVNPDMSVEVTGINNKDARQVVEIQLGMIAVHRRRVPFEVAHKNSTFRLGNTDQKGTIEIIELEGKTEAHYKVFRQQIIQVNRLLGPHAVTVNVLDTKVTPEGYLATRYQTFFRQPQTQQVLFEEESKDTYKKIGDYFVLSRQILHGLEQGQKTTTELEFTNIQLLPSS
jgi:hypothetical protein